VVGVSGPVRLTARGQAVCDALAGLFLLFALLVLWSVIIA